jgi:TolB-like protein
MLLLLLGAAVSTASAADRMAKVAVFPVENLSGASIPAAEIRQFLVERLASAGFGVLEGAELEAFVNRHRIRYLAGIDAATAALLKREAGVDGVVIASVDLSNDAVPPKLGLLVRLVSTAADPAVVWADDAGVSGDDAPGWFELGLVDDYQTLFTRALDRLSGSLVAYLKTGQAAPVLKGASKFRPKASYRKLAIQPDKVYTVAVAPFFNLSGRRNAGDILALLFARYLAGLPRFRVVEPGEVRGRLLDARIIMDGGLSISDAESVAALSKADFVLGGRALRYEDYEGPAGRTRVEFSAMLIETKTGKVVWSSDSYNEGSDGVRFFERGTSRTAHAMATQMVGLTVEAIVGPGR